MPRPKKTKVSVPNTPSAQLLAEKPKTPKSSRTNLLEDSDSEDEFHSAQQSPAEAGFKINEEYARRFEHNKKREELHRLEEKFGPNSKKRGREDDEDSEDESSSSEDEDDVGVLATETLDKEILATLEAIKNKDPRLYDGKTSFYTPIDTSTAADEVDATKSEKPMYLRDYHRENLLAGNTGDEVEVEDIPQTFVQQQEQLKRSVVKEMHTATEAEVSGDDDEENAFLVRKPSAKKDETEKEIDLPDPSLADKNPEEFLNKFLASRAWTKTSASAYVPIESDDSEEEAMADQYEFNYNMRFEDPDAAARAKIVSYGRDAISENTVRREEKSRRKRAREEKRKRKEEEKAQREIEKGRLRKLKTEELMEKFKLVREAAELSEGDEEAEAAVLNKLLEGDFSDGEWDQWMQERFGDKYYKKDGRPKKPHFDDDIDIGDIVPDFEDDLVNDDDDEGVEVEDEEMQDANDADEQQPNKKKSKKEIIKEKQAKKAKDRSTRRKVERFVEDNFDFDSELPGGNSSGFRYRETTPEAYGLGTLDILAADDTDLNQYAGLKKYAAFRDAEKKKKDKKRYAKKNLLKQWRKEVFGDANGVQMPPEWKPEGLVAIKAETAEAGKLDIRESGDGERKKKRRKKNKAKA